MDNHLSFENPDFSHVFSSSLSTLLHNASFCDVTLVCDDGQLSAHKVILAASSSFFSSVFTLNPHPHPLIYLRGVSTDLLQSVLQFVYAGVTAVREDHVPRFLALGEDLKIGGLVGYQEGFTGQEDSEPGEDSSRQQAEIMPEVSTNTVDMEYTDVTLENSEHIETKNTSVPVIKLENVSDPLKLKVEKKEMSTKIMVIQSKALPTHTSNTSNILIKSLGKTVQHLGQPSAQHLSTKMLQAPQKRKISRPAIFCSVCQKTDYKMDTLKAHLESKQEVQCKACKLFFANCFSLSKHIKGLRCKRK